MNIVTGIHRKCLANMDWREIAKRPAPEAPRRDLRRSDDARRLLESYRPSLIAKLSGVGARRRKRYLEQAQQAVDEDARRYAEATEEHQRALAEWQEMQAFASGLARGDADTVVRILKKFNPLTGIEGLGAHLAIDTDGSRYLEAVLRVHAEDVVPNFEMRPLPSFEIVQAELSPERHRRLYQDYLCGCVLRLGRELMGLVPIDLVVVHATRGHVNTVTGHWDQYPVLSVAMPRSVVQAINFAHIDCSDAMQNFAHNMRFQESSGFAPVELLKPADYLAASRRSPAG